MSSEAIFSLVDLPEGSAHNSYTIGSTLSMVDHPSTGLTFCYGLTSWRANLREMKASQDSNLPSTARVLHLHYVGEQIKSSTAVLLPEDIAQSDYIDINKVGRDAKAVIHDILCGYLQELREQDSSLIDKLKELNLLKSHTSNSLTLRKTNILQTIAYFPESLQYIREHEMFEHLDAIKYIRYVNGVVVHMITIFTDKNILMANKQSPLSLSSDLSYFDGELYLPEGKLVATGERITREEYESNAEERKTA